MKYNVRKYGALGDGSTNDTAAIQRAINALPANGGIVYFPAGKYIFSTPLDLKARRCVTLRGVGGRYVSDTAASQLQFTGSGAVSAVDMRDGFGHVLTDLQLTYNNVAFTGVVVDFSFNVGPGQPRFHVMERCYVGSTGGSPTANAVAVKLDHCINCVVRDSHFLFNDVAISGRSLTGFSNGVILDGNFFDRQKTTHILNPGEAWSITSNEFEPIFGGSMSAVSHGAGIQHRGLVFSGNWIGDVTNGGSALVLSGKGTTITGNRFGGDMTGIAIAIDENGIAGLSITGNDFVNWLHGINAGSTTGHTGIWIAANGWTNVTNRITGAAIESASV